MKLMMKIILLMSCILCMTACVPKKNEVPTSLKAGITSIQKKDYKMAYEILYPLAVQSDADAQYAIGYMMYYGKVGSANQSEGLSWIRRSASQGNTLAQRALGIFYTQAAVMPEKSR